jgi:Ca-activated chloride channel family protein
VVLISDGEETCAKDPCPTARKLAASGVNLQLEHPISNLASLPELLTSYDDKAAAVKVSERVDAILGGTAFSNAPVLTPGTWTDSLAVGETVVYRVRFETAAQGDCRHTSS